MSGVVARCSRLDGRIYRKREHTAGGIARAAVRLSSCDMGQVWRSARGVSVGYRLGSSTKCAGGRRRCRDADNRHPTGSKKQKRSGEDARIKEVGFRAGFVLHGEFRAVVATAM